MNYFGVGGEYIHDAGFTLISDSGEILFATQGERYTKVKHDHIIPEELWNKYYDPNSCMLVCNDSWKKRLEIRPNFLKTDEAKDPIIFKDECPIWKKHPITYNSPTPGHHLSHCVAAFTTRPSSFAREDCVLVSVDNIGEYQSAVIYNHKLQLKKEVLAPKSIGSLWARLTAKLGMQPNEDEYVTMGLASYGEPTLGETVLQMFDCIPDQKKVLFDLEWGRKESFRDFYPNQIATYLVENTSSHADAAASLQYATNHYLYELMKEARHYGSKLCYSGGVAQNIVSNSYFADLFDDVWIDVNPGDGGASLGAAAWAYMQDTGNDKIQWTHPYLGYNIERSIDPKQVVHHLLKHRVCGIANGPAEFSYRAYGNRSLIADVRFDIKDTVNQIKRRQKFRPFAPAILEEYADDYFEGRMNRWMQFTAKAKHDYASVTHVDGTGRVQLVPKNCKSALRQIIECYYEHTGIPMVLNTSLNIRGKPMVNNEEDAAAFTSLYDVKIF